MSRNPTDLTSGQRAGASLISIPFVALITAASLVRKGVAMAKPAPKAAPAPPAPVVREPATPHITPNTTYAVADRVCRAEVRGQQISLYQYYSAKKIRVCARINRVPHEAVFTPAIATECAIAYDFDGAIQWIRERGFNGASRQVAHGTPARTPSAPMGDEVDDPPFDPPYKSPSRAGASRQKPAAPKAQQAGAAGTQSTLVPVEGNKGKAFTGRIAWFGEETRPGRPGEKPYETYVMKVDSESGGFTKDFIGEHLAELVVQHRLRVGQLVTVQLVAKEHFTVEVNGKPEERRRNHYSIKTL